MLDTIEVFYIDRDSAVCDGGGGALGHPRVYLAIDQSGRATCPYCGRLFVQDAKRAGQSETIPQTEAASMPPPAASARN